MQSFIVHALCSGLLQVLQQHSLPLQRRLALLAFWALALFAYMLGKAAGWMAHRQHGPSLDNAVETNLAAAPADAADRANPAAEPSALLLPGGPTPGPAIAVVVPASIHSQEQGARLQHLITR